MFTPDSTERELNAIHSEHTGNVQSDNWRLNQLSRDSTNPAHPLNQFATGNLETLKENPEKLGIDVRKVGSARPWRIVFKIIRGLPCHDM